MIFKTPIFSFSKFSALFENQLLGKPMGFSNCVLSEWVLSYREHKAKLNGDHSCEWV